LVLLLPDTSIPSVYAEISPLPDKIKYIGFAHGFAFHFGLIKPEPTRGYFLVGPKGAGALLRQNFESGGGLPGVFAIAPAEMPGLHDLCLSYAKAIGCASSVLVPTTFQEETECDLFGEQTVLCGGLMELMRAAFDTLVRNGHQPEMAFFECCFEARMILDLWLKYGPRGMAERISPTALYGGWTRGRRLVTEETRREMEKIFQEIRGGDFAREWLKAAQGDAIPLRAARKEFGQSPLQAMYEKLQSRIKD
jgi:ketol-acid reductoisomerase